MENENIQGKNKKGIFTRKFSFVMIFAFFIISIAVLAVTLPMLFSTGRKDLTMDAGKPCTSKNECSGYCTLPDDVIQRIRGGDKSATTGRVEGVCSRYKEDSPYRPTWYSVDNGLIYITSVD
ncbi:MAG: hypothetical protein PHI63_02115 [Patescibacteria group bacterium]|nr:hypothetical protein [Patescibacteria group bacterium]